VIKIGVIDDDRMLLDGLRAWFRHVPGMQVTKVATTIDGFLATAGDAHVVLLDLNLRDYSVPASNVARLREAGYQVLVVSVIPDSEHVLATMEAGAVGYLTKDHDLNALRDAVRSVAAGGTAITAELAFMMSQDRRPTRPRLSPQEQAVLIAYAQGSTLEAAARRAGVALGTARAYLERVKRKYSEAGRPTRTKLELAERLREDRLELDWLGIAPGQEPGPGRLAWRPAARKTAILSAAIRPTAN
jgi:DNA-binding NarL/FixJ family response regulator